MKRVNRGIALISTFMFLGVLVMMSVSMILMSRQRAFVGVTQHHKTQALYLAEAGLAKAQVALESDLSWPGVTDATIDQMRGTYTVRFGLGKNDSVNNISKLTPAHSYRGLDTVPPNSALIIVEANVSGQQYILEALVEGQGGLGFVTDAILTSGRLRARGDLIVDGVAALDDLSPVTGSIQSNENGSSDLIVWEGGGVATVTGTVGTKGSGPSAVNMPGANILGGPEFNSQANIPNHDVGAIVGANLGHSPPPFVALGTTELASIEYSAIGNQTVNGDVVLKDGANLYVDGDLTVNGSISGEGKVYVTGKTTFKGDSSVTTNPDFSVALYSKGDVTLSGFNGTEFLQSAPGNIPTLLADAEFSLQHLQLGLKANPNLDANSTDIVNNASIALGTHTNYTAETYITLPALMQGGVEILPTRNIDVGTLVKLRTEVDNLPTGTTRTFLSKRVENLEKLFTSSADAVSVVPPGSLAEDTVIYNFDKDGTTGGFLDAVVGLNDTTHWPQAVNLINQVNYDKLGTSYFQGAIYTNGHFYADNEVNILGALLVDGNGSNSKSVSLPSGGSVTLKSGDIYLGNRTRVTYVEEMFKGNGLSPTGPQMLGGKLWMGR